MNCEETGLQLSDLLDRTLDGERLRIVREHLVGCPRCSDDLAGLTECRRLVSSLPVVEPPVGLVTRVMADVREAAHRPNIWDRLFVPVRLKMPLQAAGVVVIGILSVYLYQNEDKGKPPLALIVSEPSVPVRQESIKSESPRLTAAPGDDQEAVRTKMVTKQQPRGGAGAVSSGPVPGKASNTSSVERPGASQTKTAESLLESRPERLKSAPIPAQGVATSQESANFPGDVGGRGLSSSFDALRQLGTRPAPFPGERVFSTTEPIPDYELVVRRRPPQRADQAAPGGVQSSSQKPAEGRVASMPTEPRGHADDLNRGNSRLEILWFSVPYHRYEQFKKELAVQNVVESETPVAVKEKDASFISDRPLSIKVTVFPAAE